VTLRKLLKDLLGVDGDPGDLDREVAVRIVRRKPPLDEGNATSAVGSVVAEKIVPLARVSIFRGRHMEPAVDLVVEQDDLDRSKETLV
jgi:hypothetical protein